MFVKQSDPPLPTVDDFDEWDSNHEKSDYPTHQLDSASLLVMLVMLVCLMSGKIYGLLIILLLTEEKPQILQL